METVLILIHLMVVLALVIVVLLQRSEGGGLGIGGGGGFMSSRGQANLLTRSTAVLAAAFFATSIGLTVLARLDRSTSVLDNIPTTQIQPDAGGQEPEAGEPQPGSDRSLLEQLGGQAPATDTPATDAPAGGETPAADTPSGEPAATDGTPAPQDPPATEPEAAAPVDTPAVSAEPPTPAEPAEPALPAEPQVPTSQ